MKVSEMLSSGIINSELNRRNWNSVAANVKVFGAVGDGIKDDTLSVQKAADSLVDGGVLLFPSGFNFKITQTIYIVNTGVTLVVQSGAKITASFSTFNVLEISGDDFTLSGGGAIVSPEEWHPTTGANQWAYAVIYVAGDNCTITDITLINVPRCGVGIKEKNGTFIKDIRIFGNIPLSSVGANTVHFGITVDPPLAYPGGETTIEGNIVTGCIEGVFCGNYGSGVGYSINITGNTFRDTFDHGVYGGIGPVATLVSSNWFFNCGNPIAVTGLNNIVNANIIYYDGGGPVTTFGPVISARDAIGNVITNNTAYSEIILGGSFIIVQNLSGSEISKNRVSNNYVDSGNNPALAIRIVNGAAAPISSNNVVSDNTIKGKAKSTFGIIGMTTGNSTKSGYNNEVSGNHIIVTGGEDTSWGIFLSWESNAICRDNNVVVEFNAPATTIFRCIRTQNTAKSVIEANSMSCLAGFGTNVTLIGINEASPSTLNKVTNNNIDFSSPSLVNPTALALLSTGYRNKISNDHYMAGSATIPSGSASIVITNSNVLTTSRIMVCASNAEAGKKAFYTTVTNGSFSILIGDGTNVAANANYTWEIV